MPPHPPLPDICFVWLTCEEVDGEEQLHMGAVHLVLLLHVPLKPESSNNWRLIFFKIKVDNIDFCQTPALPKVDKSFAKDATDHPIAQHFESLKSEIIESQLLRPWIFNKF